MKIKQTDNYLSLAKTISQKANRIMKERAEEAAKLAGENEVE